MTRKFLSEIVWNSLGFRTLAFYTPKLYFICVWTNPPSVFFHHIDPYFLYGPPFVAIVLFVYLHESLSLLVHVTPQWVSFIFFIRHYLWHIYFLPYIHSCHTIHLNILILITSRFSDFPFNFNPNITKCLECKYNFQCEWQEWFASWTVIFRKNPIIVRSTILHFYRTYISQAALGLGNLRTILASLYFALNFIPDGKGLIKMFSESYYPFLFLPVSLKYTYKYSFIRDIDVAGGCTPGQPSWIYWLYIYIYTI